MRRKQLIRQLRAAHEDLLLCSVEFGTERMKCKPYVDNYMEILKYFNNPKFEAKIIADACGPRKKRT